MKKRILAVLGIAALVGVGVARADRPARDGGRGRDRGEKLKQELGLSDEQATQLRQIMQTAHKADIRRKADQEVAQMELRETLAAAVLDERALAAKIKQVSDLQTAALRARVDMALEMRKVLTPEQREKFLSLRSQDGPRARHSRRGPRDTRGPDRQDDDDARPAGPSE